jgi:hypothetical protein
MDMVDEGVAKRSRRDRIAPEDIEHLHSAGCGTSGAQGGTIEPRVSLDRGSESESSERIAATTVRRGSDYESKKIGNGSLIPKKQMFRLQSSNFWRTDLR